MDEKVYRVIKGYSELSYEQRREVREQIEKFEREEFGKRKLLIESLQKSLGPINQDICPCCGR